MGAIGAFLAFLVVVFIVGNLWFHLVESILGPDQTAVHPPSGASGLASPSLGAGGAR